MNTQYRKNLKAVLEASKSYIDKRIDDLQWELGTYDLGVDTNTDTAHIKTLPSGTIQTTVAKVEGVGYKVNQLYNYSGLSSVSANSGTITNNNDGSFTLSTESGGATANVSLQQWFYLTQNHKYLFCGISALKNKGCVLSVASGGQTYDNNAIFNFTSATTSLATTIRINSGTILSSPITIYPMCFDLTADFGSGNEPSTVSDCATEYAKRGIDIYSYTPQQSSIKNNAFTGVKVEGANYFSLTSSDLEIGAISGDGTDSSSTIRIRIKNTSKIFLNAGTYKLSFSGLNQFVWYGYTSSTATQATYNTNAQWQNSGTTFTLTNDCYVRFAFKYEDNRTTASVNELTNVNLIDTATPTTTIPIDLTTIKDSNNVSLFPSGKMMGNSSVADFITPTNQESRWNEVDLGSLNWILYPNSTSIFYAIISDKKNSNESNLVCALYNSVAGYSIINLPNMTISDAGGTAIYIRNDNYTSASDFKTAMSGVMLQYERATYLTSNTDLTSLTRINAQSNGTITLNNTDNVDMPNTIKSLKEVAK